MYSYSNTNVAIITLFLVSGVLTGVHLAKDDTTYNTYEIDDNFDFNANNSSEIHVRELPRREKLEPTEWVPVDEANISGYRSDIVEVTRYPKRNVTDEDFENGYELYKGSFKAAKQNGWFDLKKAFEDGYYNWMRDPTHYPNNEFILNNDQNLNPDQPEFLYYQRPKNSTEPVLTGVMYLMNENYEHGPQPAGPLTEWHWHQYDVEICQPGQVLQLSEIHNDCSFYSANRTAEMMHVWFIEHPDGQFATNMAFDKKWVEKDYDMLSREEFEESFN
jgi:hypothetical protein